MSGPSTIDQINFIKRFPRLLLVLLFAFVSTGAFGQKASVRGFVSDSTSHEVLAGVNVVLTLDDGGILGAAADADGYFVINRIRPGTVGIRVSFIGYQTIVDTLDLGPGDVRMLKIQMIPDETELGEIVIEAEAADGAATSVAPKASRKPWCRRSLSRRSCRRKSSEVVCSKPSGG